MIDHLAVLLATSGANGGLLEWFGIESTARMALVAFGIVGQVIFFARWIVQWLASEARGTSHVPEAFWWCSLAGASMLLVYFFLDRDPVGILGQSVGWIVYGRNLMLMKTTREPRGRE